MKAKGDKVIRKTLADGTQAEYRYPRKGNATAAKDTPRYAPGTLADLLHAYELSSDYRNLSKASKTNRQIYLRKLTDWHDTPAHEIERDMLMELADAIDIKSGPGAANAFLTATSTLYNWAIERGKFKHANPLYRAKRYKQKRLPTIKPEQYAVALAGLPEPLRRVLVLGFWTGQRRGDLIRLTWANYDGQRLRFTQQKHKHNEEPVEMNLLVAPELKAELDAWKALAHGSNVVPLHGADPIASRTILTNFDGRPWQPEVLSRRMRVHFEALGLREPGQRGINVHGLRKLTAVSLAERGLNVHQIRAVTGHKTLAMVQLYTEEADTTLMGDEAIMSLSKKGSGNG